MEADNKLPVELFGKYFAGEATPEEALRIDEWIDDPANKAEWEKMLKLWSLSGEPIPTTPLTTEAWPDLQSAIEKDRGGTAVRRILMNRYIVAACVVGLILISVLIAVRQKKNTVYDGTNSITEIQADSLQKIHLPDGSVVSMIPKSSIRYESSFNVSGRSISLQGESYFTVAHNASKPFIITIGALSIKVVGTAFNVRQVADSHSIEVQVQAGIVQMQSTAGTVLVKKEQTGIYNTRNHELKVEEGIDANSIGYATKTFLFQDLPLSDVCHYLQKSFDTPIQLDETVFRECRITAQFDNSPLNYILDVITTTVNARYTLKNNEVFIEGKGCK